MNLPFKNFIWTRTRIIQLCTSIFLLGLLAARHGWTTSPALIIASLVCCGALFRYKKLSFLLLGLLALNLGLWRGQAVFLSYQPLFDAYGEKVTVIGEVQDDTSIGDRYQTEFHMAKLRINDQADAFKQVGGRLQIRGFSQDAKVYRGDIVKVEGKLRSALGNNQGQISFAQINVIGRKVSFIETIRRQFFAGVYTALPEPQASLGLGFLVGLRTLLPKELLDQLAKTGLIHIVAVSGYNLTILVRFMRRLLARYSKYLATAGSVALIGGFLAVTGLSPSIFRAAIVSGLALAAWYYGRPIKPMLLILLAAALTAGINPSYIWYDIGWYLSFLSFYGVLVLAPTILGRIYKSKQPPATAELIVETLSAQIMILPLSAFIFGQVSLISLPANLIVLPLIPLAMLLTFIAGLAGMSVPAVVGWFAWPANIILTFIVRAVNWLASLPWASAEIKIGSFHLIILYVIVMVVVVAARRNLDAKQKTVDAIIR